MTYNNPITSHVIGQLQLQIDNLMDMLIAQEKMHPKLSIMWADFLYKKQLHYTKINTCVLCNYYPRITVWELESNIDLAKETVDLFRHKNSVYHDLRVIQFIKMYSRQSGASSDVTSIIITFFNSSTFPYV